MISYLRQKIVGGDTGKREMGLGVFLAYCLAWIFQPGERELLSQMLIPVLGFIAAVYGLEWHGSQSKWKANDHVEFHPDE
jgi:hypothetical protein